MPRVPRFTWHTRGTSALQDHIDFLTGEAAINFPDLISARAQGTKVVGLVWRCPVVSGLVSHAPLAARGRAALHELVMAVTDVSCDASLAAISRPRPLVSSSAAVCSRRPAEPQLRRCMMGLAWTTMPSAGAALAPGPGKLAAAAGKLSSKEAESSDRTAASPSAACTQW